MYLSVKATAMPKVLMLSLGSRGDMEPFLAIAAVLGKQNWEVTCAFPEQFRELVAHEGYGFKPFTRAFLDLIEGPQTRKVMGRAGNPISRTVSLIRLAVQSLGIQKTLVAETHDFLHETHYDLVLYHAKCPYASAWSMAHPGRAILLLPVPCLHHPVDHYAAIGMKGSKNRGRLLNRLSYWLINQVKAVLISKAGKRYQHDLPGLRFGRAQVYRHMLVREQVWYSISPALFPQPDYWPAVARIIGYRDRDKTRHWEPEEALSTFLARHDKILFISFGSMINQRPGAVTTALIQVLRRLDIPAIINSSWGGLEVPDECPEQVLFVKDIPYDWLMPQVYAVVHHGGSGTTHSALRYGCASLIIPHIIDQFFWNQLLADHGLSPRGIPINRVTAQRLEPLLLDLWTNPAYKSRSIALGKRIAQEGSEEELLQLLGDFMSPTGAR